MLNQIYIRPDNQTLVLEGWAVSDDINTILQIFIDGKKISTNITRTSRPDVDIAVSTKYGGVVNTPNAGFCGKVNISDLEKGNHSIKVQQLSRYGDFICEISRNITIENKKYVGDIFIDYPTHNKAYKYGNAMSISGWAVSDDENTSIQIYIDGILKINASRYYRGDVIEYMKKYQNKTTNAGFISEISTEGLSKGSHKLTVKEKSRYGDDIVAKDVIFIIENPVEDEKNDSILIAGSKGIDVSQHQGNIDWTKVAKSGIKFSMIRIGYRGYGTGGLAEDTKYKDNLKNASDNGLKVGVYYYSTAINTNEAKKDAEYVLKLLKKYGYQNKLTMPIAIDLEVNSSNVRDANVSKSVRTNIANTFCSIIKNNGYTPMVYASKAFLKDNINVSQINNDIWVAQYNSKCTYTGSYTMWQYSSSGKVSGISGNVDCNICYKNY